MKAARVGNLGCSSSELSTKHAVLVNGFKLAPRPGIFAILGFLKMDVLLIGLS